MLGERSVQDNCKSDKMDLKYWVHQLEIALISLIELAPLNCFLKSVTTCSNTIIQVSLSREDVEIQHWSRSREVTYPVIASHMGQLSIQPESKYVL